MKVCTDCKHCKFIGGFHRCYRNASKISLVTGGKLVVSYLCATERGENPADYAGECGEEGRFFEKIELKTGG
jgi:hypothetical protein